MSQWLKIYQRTKTSQHKIDHLLSVSCNISIWLNLLEGALSSLRQFLAIKTDEKRFLFQPKSYFCSQDI